MSYILLIIVACILLRIVGKMLRHFMSFELAYAVGFSAPQYFSTCFKKEFGMQLREYCEKFIAAKE